ncbi:MAG TPA: SDR family NAD(P)-dependent oxidoreductase [Acetobacteraceae bacterium]
MARIFITGSSDGLGRMAAQLLVEEGHQVVLHARNADRGRNALAAVPGAAAVLTGDMASIAQTRRLAEAANAHGPFDAVIHNAAIGFRERRRVLTEDGLPHVFAINTLAPYVLTALIRPPARMVYVSSELHRRGHAGLDDLLWERRDWRGNQAYSDTKLHDALLAFAVARRWPSVRSNALEPGWVATKMGGAHASGDLDAAHRTQAWLAVSDDAGTAVTGEYFFHKHLRKPSGATRDIALQDGLLAECARLSGVPFPDHAAPEDASSSHGRRDGVVREDHG